jgi:hypothetical protein
MADGYEKLLMYIVDHLVMSSESRDSEIEAPASRDVEAEIAGVAEDQRADAKRLAPYFAEGLRRAIAGNGHLEVQDTDDDGNGIADAFARFLVTTNLATSSSTEIGNDHYTYSFDVDLPKLNEIARLAGTTL